MADTVNEKAWEATRCLLTPNPARFFSDTFLGMYTNIFRLQAPPDPLPRLAIDIGTDAIRVVDVVTNQLVASSSPSGVTATPANHIFSTRSGRSTEPVLIVHVPGMQPLTIAPNYEPGTVNYSWIRGGFVYPFGWRGEVPRERPATYLVSCADWPTLVETFGLTAHLEQNDPGGRPTSSVGTPPSTGSAKVDQWLASEPAPRPLDVYSTPEYIKGLQRYSRVMWWMVGISLIWCLAILAVVLVFAFTR